MRLDVAAPAKMCSQQGYEVRWDRFTPGPADIEIYLLILVEQSELRLVRHQYDSRTVLPETWCEI